LLLPFAVIAFAFPRTTRIDGNAGQGGPEPALETDMFTAFLFPLRIIVTVIIKIKARKR
jgi:hypothetical protein